MRLMPAPGSGRWLCLTSPSTAAPPRWPCPRAGGPTRCWAGCTPLTRAAPTRLRSAAPADAVPFLPTPRSRTRRGGLRGPAHGGHPPHRRGGSSPALDVAPPGRLGPRALRARVLARDDPRGPAPPQAVWKKAKKLLGRADPERRQAFIEQLQDGLAGAQRDRHLVVYLDEAHLHQDTDLGYGWAKRGERFFVASSSPGLSARVSVYGVYLYNEGQGRLWPFRRANGDHTIAVLRRLRAAFPDAALIVLWEGAPYHRAKSPGGRDGPEYHADAAAGLQPGSEARGGALALAAGGCHRSPLPCQRRRPHPAGGGLRGAPEPRSSRHRRPPLGQRPPRPRAGENALLKIDVV